jgi:hypothetical protein
MTVSMQAYAVTLVFADGSIFSNVTTSHAREVALAASVQAAARDNPAVPDLTGFSIIDLPAEKLRAMLRQIEGQQGQVVSLAIDNPRQAAPNALLDQMPPQPNPLNVRFPTGPTEGDGA